MSPAGKNILIIEDNPFNMELIRDFLDLKGYTTYEAVNAEDGIRVAREILPHLVLMDIQLPGMDGIEATRILKSDEKTKAIHVIAVTAHAMKGYKEELMAQGFDDYISKPVELKVLIEKVSDILGV